jgi:hypothetical protein
MRAITDTVAEQQQGRAEQLAPRPEQVVVDLADRGEIGQHDPSELVHDALEVLRTGRWIWDSSGVRVRSMGAERSLPVLPPDCQSRASRSETSWKLMSIPSTRS